MKYIVYLNDCCKWELTELLSEVLTTAAAAAAAVVSAADTARRTWDRERCINEDYLTEIANVI